MSPTQSPGGQPHTSPQEASRPAPTGPETQGDSALHDQGATHAQDMQDAQEAQEAAALAAQRGPLAWMAKNSVAANLLMLLLIVGGVLMLSRVKQEVFPEVELDAVLITVAQPGVAPAEIEQGIILAIEEQVRSVDDVKEVVSTAREGVATLRAELLLGTDSQQALNEIKSVVDRVPSLPEDAERPVISLASNRREVISLVVYGDKDERALRQLAEQVRDELLTDPKLTVVELDAVRRPEISVEVPQEQLRRYNLTLEQVAQAIRLASVDVSAGGVKTRRGEVLLRTTERRELGREFYDIVVLSRPDGSTVTVRDLGVVIDGFEESDRAAFFDGKRAARVIVYRVGDQTPLEISAAVNAYRERKLKALPEGVSLAVWNDSSEAYRDRISLLLRNAMQGLVLVLLVLGLFLEIRLAFWVTLGIPISFLGAILFMPWMDVSLNMISLFAFILTLGIVVDDAIVAGEAIYTKRQAGMGPLQAAIAGVKEVATPVIFSVLTTVVAFSPLLFVPGITGKFFKNIPMIVIPILLLSLVESLMILPAHLGHGKPPSERGFLGFVFRQQQRFAQLLERLIERFYEPMVRAAVRQRYLTMAAGLSVLILAGGVIGGGRIKFDFFPKIEGDLITANVALPFGASARDTERVMQHLIHQAQQSMEELGGQQALSRGLFAVLDTAGSHTATVSVFMVPLEQRQVTTTQLANRWRERVGELAGVDKLTFNFSTGFSGGSPVDVELSHPDQGQLELAAQALAQQLRGYNGLFDIDSGLSLGKEQLDFKLTPEARALGVTESELGRQLRSAFFGAAAGRQQRGRDELRVFVRRPQAERSSEYDVEQLMIRAPGGAELPLSQAAVMERGRSFTEIIRKNGKRLVHVTSDLDITKTSSAEVLGELRQRVLPELMADYPSLTYAFGGADQNRRESLGALRSGFMFALLVMFGMMAVVFKSYAQPLIVLFAIPFGVVGALGGHLLMGYDLSIISIMGIVALSGVVVNDSLVYIDAVNTYRREGATASEAVILGGVRRFRPILLTSLTTFFGLAPMIAEKSVQARFLIPMALSLGFGVLFVTLITLIIVPALYMVIEDGRRAGSWLADLYRPEAEHAADDKVLQLAHAHAPAHEQADHLAGVDGKLAAASQAAQVRPQDALDGQADDCV